MDIMKVGVLISGRFKMGRFENFLVTEYIMSRGTLLGMSRLRDC